MTDQRIIDIIADAASYALRIHPYGPDLGYPFAEYADRVRVDVADFVLAALRGNGMEIVTLPKPDDWDAASWWESSVRVLDSPTDRQYPIAIEAVPGEVSLVDIGYATEFAGALLAAANKAAETTE